MLRGTREACLLFAVAVDCWFALSRSQSSRGTGCSGCRWSARIWDPFLMRLETSDQGMGQMPVKIVLSRILCNGFVQNQAEVRPVRVIGNNGGLWAVSVCHCNACGRQEFQQRFRQDASVIPEFHVWYQVEMRCAWFYHPFVETVVRIIATSQSEITEYFTSSGEERSGGCLIEHLFVLRAQCDERDSALTFLVEIVFFDFHRWKDFVFEVLEEGQLVSDRVAVLGRCHFSLNLRSEICSCCNQELAQAGTE